VVEKKQPLETILQQGQGVPSTEGTWTRKKHQGWSRNKKRGGEKNKKVALKIQLSKKSQTAAFVKASTPRRKKKRRKRTELG